tara:strand:- start:1461 stop:2609 length:1149 start_codon:yes stop_codon:yes gene_type:complete
MPRLSMYKPNKTFDYSFHDNRIREMFTVGGTGVNIHKYLGTFGSDGSDKTKPKYDTITENRIQDLLFLENRDRKYDTSVYELRGIYNVQDIDFDLTQFGLFLANDTLFINFHMQDMVDGLGRKLMSGDVLELPHLKDFYPLDEDLNGALRRYYVIQDAARASEGFSPTWYPHIWRVKCTPLVDSQEYRDILGKSDDNNSLKNLLSTYKRELEHNKSIVDQAKLYVPKSGYDTEKFYVQPTDSQGQPIDPKGFTADDTNTKASSSRSVDSETLSPTGSGWTSGYLTGDGIAPNGFPVTTAISFPTSPLEGDFVLRLDYKPNRLFRYDGNRWIKVEDSVRTTLDGDGLSQRDGFINNTGTYVDNKGKAKPSRTGLSKALEPDED